MWLSCASRLKNKIRFRLEWSKHENFLLSYKSFGNCNVCLQVTKEIIWKFCQYQSHKQAVVCGGVYLYVWVRQLHDHYALFVCVHMFLYTISVCMRRRVRLTLNDMGKLFSVCFFFLFFFYFGIVFIYFVWIEWETIAFGLRLFG